MKIAVRITRTCSYWVSKFSAGMCTWIGLGYCVHDASGHYGYHSPVLCDSAGKDYRFEPRKFLGSQGAPDHHIGTTIGDTEEHGKGLFCETRDIPPNSVIIHVPAGSVLSAETITTSSSDGHIYTALQLAGLDDRGILALWLVTEKLKENQSQWCDYICQLPTLFDLAGHHVLLSDVPLHGTSLGVSAENMRRNIRRQVKMVVRALQGLGVESPLLNMPPGAIEDIWSWAHTIVLTRSGIVNSGGASRDWTAQALCIVPHIDFANHGDEPNARVRVNPDGSVDLVSIVHIHKGDEIRISYWHDKPLTSEQSLFSFGFPSGHERFALPGVGFTGSESDPRKAIQRLLFLDSGKTAHDDNIYLDDIESAVRYFTIETMDTSALNKLTHAYIAEGCLGPQTQDLLTFHEGLGQLRLLDILTRWKSELDTRPTLSNVSLNQYLLNLKRHVDLAIEQLVAHSESS